MPDNRQRDERHDLVVPVMREEAHVRAVPVETGAVRVTKSRDIHEELIEQELRKGRAEVTRVPVNRVVDGPQSPWREANTLIIPVVSEVLNGCEKQWVVTEEIRVTRLETAEAVQQKVPLTTETARVERLDEHGRVVATEQAPATPPASPPNPPAASDSILEKRKAAAARTGRKKVLSSTDSILRDRPPKKSR